MEDCGGERVEDCLEQMVVGNPDKVGDYRDEVPDCDEELFGVFVDDVYDRADDCDCVEGAVVVCLVRRQVLNKDIQLPLKNLLPIRNRVHTLQHNPIMPQIDLPQKALTQNIPEVSRLRKRHHRLRRKKLLRYFQRLL